MRTDNLKLVIVGHVDHGKSTLIGRLFYDTDSLPEGKIQEIKEVCEAQGKDMEFGYVMDNLSEERDQGITIDTTQTYFKTKQRDYVIIDAPGHVEFIKNMITGASQAHAAILIVDAAEGVKQQTRRHAYILSMLGLKQVIVAVNKLDKIDFSQREYRGVRKEVKEFLKTINITPTYFIPISAREGDNIAKESSKMSWYEGPTVLTALDSFKPPRDPDDKPLILPIQDVYKYDDERIVAGKIAQGTIKPREDVVVQPTGMQTKIKAIVEWESDQDNPFGGGDYAHPTSASSGKSTGVTLTEPLFCDRGQVITQKDHQPRVVNEFKAHIFWLDKKPYRKGERITIKLATQEVLCEIKRIRRVIDSSTLKVLSEDAGEIGNREVADVEISLPEKMVVEDFNETPQLGRFVLDRHDTVAGGIITGWVT
ncbi:MAG: GTP-binding protein [Candidatus Altiarchaeales archaeon]|nr:GTP-binding protein [Candidatus Altiarchaeales archaeon]